MSPLAGTFFYRLLGEERRKMKTVLFTVFTLMALPLWADTVSHQDQAEQRFVTNIKYFPQPEDAPAEVYAVIEIPAGSFTKYELDAATGHLLVDRFQSMPVVYPANYGTLPSSLAGDGDPLDILVYTREPIVPGALIKVRPIGVLNMLDAGEEDDKIIAVPADKVDPGYTDIREVKDLPGIEVERLTAFFRVYKQLPEGRKKVELGGVSGSATARRAIAEALANFRQHGNPGGSQRTSD